MKLSLRTIPRWLRPAAAFTVLLALFAACANATDEGGVPAVDDAATPEAS
ncbi:MAG: hypothetical protein QOI41_2907, partial [Myxococcales bacterium]|nr:hypothetical protein [Myxococcales bacterium]